MRRVVHLRMELYSPCALAVHAEGRATHVLRAADDAERFRRVGDGVAVRHPYLRGGGEGAHKRVLGVGHLKHGAAIFACGSRLHRPSGEPGEVLGAVADSQQRQFSAERVERGAWRVRVRYGVRTSRENHAERVGVDLRDVVERMDLAIHIELTYAACDQLGVLRSEIDYQNFLHGLSVSG